MNKLIAKSNDIINRKVLEPAFEALVDAGKYISMNPYILDVNYLSIFNFVLNCGIYSRVTKSDNEDVNTSKMIY